MILNIGNLVILLSALFLVGVYITLAFKGVGQPKRDAQGKPTGEREDDTYATYVRLDTFKFVSKGESLLKVLPNLRKAYLNWDNQVVTTTSNNLKWYQIIEKVKRKLRLTAKPTYFNPINMFLKKYFGIYFVSILYPSRKLFKFNVRDVHRYQENAAGPLSNSVKVEASKPVSELYRIIKRPLYAEVTLGDGTIVDMVIMAEGSAIDPVRPAFTLNGDFFGFFDAGIKGAYEDYFNRLDYENLKKKPTGKGSELSNFVRAVNPSLIESSGYEVTECYIIEMRPHGALANASQNVAIAESNKKAAEINAQADASRFAGPIQAMIDKGVNPDLAASLFTRDQVSRNIAGSGSVISFSEAGSSGGAGVVLPAPANPPKTQPTSGGTPPPATP